MYIEQNKQQFHKTWNARLHELARLMGLHKAEYTVRSCTGGPAVLGEVVLHTDRVYVSVGDVRDERGPIFMYRTCEGRTDYAGGRNHWEALAALENTPSAVAATLQGLVRRTSP